MSNRTNSTTTFYNCYRNDRKCSNPVKLALMWHRGITENQLDTSRCLNTRLMEIIRCVIIRYILNNEIVPLYQYFICHIYLINDIQCQSHLSSSKGENSRTGPYHHGIYQVTYIVLITFPVGRIFRYVVINRQYC